MKIIKFVTATLFAAISGSAAAQYGLVPVDYANGPYGYYDDALTFSRLTINGGTARFQGIGGAGTALGADIGASYVNPAGLGMFKNSELSLTPNLAIANTKTDFLNNTEMASKIDFGFSNLGIVFCGAKKENEEGDFRGGSFAISFTRTNQFNNRYAYKGINTNSSMMDYFVNRVNSMGISQSSLDDQYGYNADNISDIDGLSYAAFLFDTSGNTNTYRSFVNNDVVQQQESVTIKGASYQWNFAYGASYKDKLYIGACVGIPTFSYRKEREYKETVGIVNNGSFQDMADTIDNFRLTDVSTTIGTGINFKVGIIAKPIEAIRIGVSVVTPTYYFSMEDAYKTSITASFEPNTLSLATGGYIDYSDVSTLDGKYNYSFSAPMRANAGLAVFAGKFGFVSGDVELIPYNTGSFTGNTLSGAFELNEDNKTIAKLYKDITLNYKIGGELRFDIFRLRAGYAFFGDPYTETTYDRDMHQFSGGIGFRLTGFYLDMTYSNLNYISYTRPYILKNGGEPIAKINNTVSNFIITAGFTF